MKLIYVGNILALLRFLLHIFFCCSWVAYEKSGFTGHQYLLEEGEYKDWKDWGGYNGELQSLRPILGVS